MADENESKEQTEQKQEENNVNKAVTLPIRFDLENPKPTITITIHYCAATIDETRKSISIEQTHDNNLKQSLLNKGIKVEDSDILIPLKRSKKNIYCPPYFPFNRLGNNGGKGAYMLYISDYEITVLIIEGDPLKCIDKAYSS